MPPPPPSPLPKKKKTFRGKDRKHLDTSAMQINSITYDDVNEGLIMLSIGIILRMKVACLNQRVNCTLRLAFLMHRYISFISDCGINIFTTVKFLFTGSCSSYINIKYYGSYSSPSHLIQSPNYPGCYPNNKVCTWLIETNGYNYIELNIHQLNLEYGGSNCPNDYLEIRDGNTLSSPLITKMCGSLGYTYLYSSGRFLLVRFVSDGYLQMNGFLADCYGVIYSKKNTFSSLKYVKAR